MTFLIRCLESDRPVTIAKVVSTFLGVESHGLLTAIVHLDFGGGGVGAGGYALSVPIKGKDGHFEPTGYATVFVTGVLRAAGVDTWEAVKGRTLLAIREDESWSAKVIGLMPLPTEPGSAFLFSELDLLGPNSQPKKVNAL